MRKFKVQDTDIFVDGEPQDAYVMLGRIKADLNLLDMVNDHEVARLVRPGQYEVRRNFGQKKVYVSKPSIPLEKPKALQSNRQIVRVRWPSIDLVEDAGWPHTFTGQHAAMRPRKAAVMGAPQSKPFETMNQNLFYGRIGTDAPIQFIDGTSRMRECSKAEGYDHRVLSTESYCTTHWCDCGSVCEPFHHIRREDNISTPYSLILSKTGDYYGTPGCIDGNETPAPPGCGTTVSYCCDSVSPVPDDTGEWASGWTTGTTFPVPPIDDPNNEAESAGYWPYSKYDGGAARSLSYYDCVYDKDDTAHWLVTYKYGPVPYDSEDSDYWYLKTDFGEYLLLSATPDEWWWDPYMRSAYIYKTPRSVIYTFCYTITDDRDDTTVWYYKIYVKSEKGGITEHELVYTGDNFITHEITSNDGESGYAMGSLRIHCDKVLYVSDNISITPGEADDTWKY